MMEELSGWVWWMWSVTESWLRLQRYFLGDRASVLGMFYGIKHTARHLLSLYFHRQCIVLQWILNGRPDRGHHGAPVPAAAGEAGGSSGRDRSSLSAALPAGTLPSRPAGTRPAAPSPPVSAEPRPPGCRQRATQRTQWPPPAQHVTTASAPHNRHSGLRQHST